jgi:hypothetical protein
VVLPLTLIYLHQVRGIALPVVGALMASTGLVGLVAVPLAGGGDAHHRAGPDLTG